MTADLDTFNPFDPETLQCPFPHYAKMRDEQPVMYLDSLDIYLIHWPVVQAAGVVLPEHASDLLGPDQAWQDYNQAFGGEAEA